MNCVGNFLKTLFVLVMKKSISLLVFLVLATICSGFSPFPVPSSRTVWFGDPSQDICVGRGVCKNHLSSENAEGISVTFAVMQSNPDVLIMTFSLSALQASQPDQVSYFTSAQGTYNFQSTYVIPDDMVQQLGLQPGAKITPSSPTSVSINGDAVTTLITYAHN